VVKRPFGNPSLLAPWDKVKGFGENEVIIDIDDLKKIEGEPEESMLLLRDHVLDKKILDLEDTEVEIVYDLKLVMRKGKMFVSAVDSSRYGRMRRFGFQRTADHRQNANGPNENIIPWTYVQPLPPNLTSFKGEVKLKILRENLSEMQPADIADMLEELDQDHRVVVFNQLETERASDTLEEIDPNVQRELISSLNKDRVADLVDRMTPGQAADLFGALPHDMT
jgi:magnesium transporter